MDEVANFVEIVSTSLKKTRIETSKEEKPDKHYRGIIDYIFTLDWHWM